MIEKSMADYVVFCGRFEPFHVGHLKVLKKGLEHGRKVIVLIGSAFKPRTIKNPWTAAEREQMIRASLDAHDNARVVFKYICDHAYIAGKWLSEVQEYVNEAIVENGDVPSEVNVRLIGRDKDASSSYLHDFPQWGPLLEVDHCDSLSATELRAYLFSGTAGGISLLKANVPAPVVEILEVFQKNSCAYQSLVDDYNKIKEDKKVYEGLPVEVQHLAVDSVVSNRGHVLLQKRHVAPGKGLWALPGGFLGPRERLLNSAVRYIHATTEIKLPNGFSLEKSLVKTHVFDHVERSERSRIVSHGFHFELNEAQLPKVRAKSKWFPFSEVKEMREHLFEDHFDMIELFTRMS